MALPWAVTPLLPLARRRTVSLVEVSPSMEMELKLVSTAAVEHGVRAGRVWRRGR